MDPQEESATDRYRRQAEIVMRLAARAETRMEKELYLSIAEGWRKLAIEALRHEKQERPRVADERRTFLDDGAD